jgi:Fe-S-cluster containining protein
MAKSEKQPWYKDGLRFKCTGCGDCCTGAPGFVWVNNEEIAAIAAEIGMHDVAAFEAQYVRTIGVRKSLIESEENYDCVFLDGTTRKCTVYNARPRQCRTWPFWDSTTRTPQAWAATCEVCPGSGTGKLYQLDVIEAQKAVIRI